jgi:hypothetical protein
MPRRTNQGGLILYHGTGNVSEVIEALKNNTFISHRSGKVENGIYLTPYQDLAFDYAKLTGGKEIGLVKITFRVNPIFKVYANASEQYNDERSFYKTTLKNASLQYKKNLIDNGYDGYTTSAEVYLLFSEKYNLIQKSRIEGIVGENKIYNFPQFYESIKKENGTKYIGQKFIDIFPFLKGKGTPFTYKQKVNQYFDILNRLEDDNYTTPAMKTRDLNKQESMKKYIDKMYYLSRFVLDSQGTIIDFEK